MNTKDSIDLYLVLSLSPLVSYPLSIYLFAFGPAPLVDSLIALSETAHLVGSVGVKHEDEDSVVYHQLAEHLRDIVQDDYASPIMIFSPQLGDRFSTIALSIPKYHIHVISGMNVELLSALKYRSDLSAMIAHRSKGDEESPLSTNDESLDLDSIVDFITAQARRGLVILNAFLRDEGEESNIDASILETDISELT